MPTISNSKAQDVLDPNWIETYRWQIKALWFQAVELNVNSFILGKIVEFPFELLVPNQVGLWNLLAKSLYESCVMAVWRLVVDSDTDCLTVSRLRNEMMQRIPDQQARKEIKSKLTQINFNKRFSQAKDDIRRLRHKRLVHHDKDTAQLSIDKQFIRMISLSELKSIKDTINELIQSLAFEREYHFLIPEYHPSVMPPQDVDPRPDIEIVLDQLAASSELLNMPENDPHKWYFRSQHLSDKDLETLNAYRKKLGLEPAEERPRMTRAENCNMRKHITCQLLEWFQRIKRLVR